VATGTRGGGAGFDCWYLRCGGAGVFFSLPLLLPTGPTSPVSADGYYMCFSSTTAPLSTVSVGYSIMYSSPCRWHGGIVYSSHAGYDGAGGGCGRTLARRQGVTWTRGLYRATLPWTGYGGLVGTVVCAARVALRHCAYACHAKTFIRFCGSRAWFRARVLFCGDDACSPRCRQ